MVVMTDEVYKLLTAPRRTKYRIEQTKSRITALRYTLMPSGIRYDTDKVQSSPSDMMPEKMAKIDDLEQYLAELYAEYDSEMSAITAALEAINREPEKTVLMMQYVGGHNVIEIADILNYSIRSVYYIRSRGYDLLAENISA